MGQHQTGGEFWRRQQSSGMSLPLSIDGTDKQTDERTDTRPLHTLTAYYAADINKLVLSYIV